MSTSVVVSEGRYPQLNFKMVLYEIDKKSNGNRSKPSRNLHLNTVGFR